MFEFGFVFLARLDKNKRGLRDKRRDVCEYPVNLLLPK